MKTGLRIRVLEGQTVDGRIDYEFPSSPSQPNELIVIGRDPDRCQIVFNDDLRRQGLGNEHIAFRRSLGSYQLDLRRRNDVLLDGKATFEEKELRGTHVLQLGDAVKLEVTVVDDRSATIGGKDGDQLPEITIRNRRLLAGLVTAVAALAVGGWWLKSQQERLQEKAEEVAKVIGEAMVPADALERAARSVYLVVAKSDAGGEDPVGTGWSAPGGVIVTNAHIAEEIPSSDEGVRWVVRSAVPPYREHAITARRIHPGYEAFQTLVGAIKPVQEEIRAYTDVGQALACDVAVLEVEDSDALSPSLPISTREDLATLEAGDPVAIVGFPDEGLASTPVLTAAPVPVRHRGFLVRVTDFFIREREDGINQLIQHGLPVTGGSSGSPIIDSRGRVIAVHNGGNTLGRADFGRIISQVVSYGQRADLVLDLLEKTESEHLAEYRRMWTASLTGFQREADVRMVDHFRETADVMGQADAKPSVVDEFFGEAIVAEAEEDLRRAVPISLELQPGVYTLRVAAKDFANTADLDILLFDKWGNRVGADASGSVVGLVRLVNVHPQAYRLIGWVQSAEEPVPYSCTLHRWPCDAEEYLESQVVRALSSNLATPGGPGFDVRTKATRLAGAAGASGRCIIEAIVPKPGIYAAIGRVSEALPVAMTLTGGGQVLDANTSPASEGGEANLVQSPIVVFKVDKENVTVRFACESAMLDEADGRVQIDAHILGWPGLEIGGNDE